MLSCKLWSYCPYNNLSKNICRSASVFISLFLNWTHIPQNYRAHGLCFVCRRLVVASFATYNTHSCNCCCFSKRLAILRPTLTHKHTQTYSAHYTHTHRQREGLCGLHLASLGYLNCHRCCRRRRHRHLLRLPAFSVPSCSA